MSNFISVVCFVRETSLNQLSTSTYINCSIFPAAIVPLHLTVVWLKQKRIITDFKVTFLFNFFP